MPLDPSTLCARTSAGDAELAAPRNGLAIAQRRLLTLLDKPVALDELASRPGLQPDRLERDLARLAEHGLIEIHRPAGSTGPMFPAQRRPAAMIDLPPPPTPTITQGPASTARTPGWSPAAAPVVGRRVRRGRAILVGFASLVAIGLAAWLFAPPAPEPPPRATPAPRPPTVTPPPPRGQAALPAVPAPTSAKSIDQVRALVVADPVPSRPAAVTAPAPVALETRIAPLTLVPLTREVPEFPREALDAGRDQGRVKARLTIDDLGRVRSVDIVEAEPRRVFDRTVSDTLARWTFAPGAGGRTTDVEIAFKSN